MTYRLLLASEFYPPFIGGAELQTQILARGLAARGHTVSLATTWHAGLVDRENDQGVDVHRLHGWFTRVPWFSSNPKRRFHPPVLDPGTTSGLRDIIRDLQPDVVHASGWIAYSCAAAVRELGIPLILSVRDYGYSCAVRTLMHMGERVCDGPAPAKCLQCAADRYGWPKAIGAVGGVLGARKLLAHNPSAIHCVSRYVETIVRRDFLAVGEPGDDQAVRSVTTIPDIVIIPNIMEPENDDHSTSRSATIEEVMAQLPREPFILFVGALQMHKGLGPLLSAYQQLRNAPPLVLMGSVWADTPTTFPAGVTVMRDVPHPAVMRAWEHALFGVVPSIWPDPLPGTVREAMSRGKAVIGSAMGGIIDMVDHGQTGLLVPPGNADSLRSAMELLIEDVAYRERLGDNARTQAQRFADYNVLPRWEALYGQIIAAREKQYA